MINYDWTHAYSPTDDTLSVEDSIKLLQRLWYCLLTLFNKLNIYLKNNGSTKQDITIVEKLLKKVLHSYVEEQSNSESQWQVSFEKYSNYKHV